MANAISWSVQLTSDRLVVGGFRKKEILKSVIELAKVTSSDPPINRHIVELVLSGERTYQIPGTDVSANCELWVAEINNWLES